VPRKRPRKGVANSRPRPQAPTGPNQVWAFDFVFDACANGYQLKCLTVEGEFTKEGLAIEVDGRIRSGRVIDLPTGERAGAAKHLRYDNSPEFGSRALLKWVVDQGIGDTLHPRRSGGRNRATDAGAVGPSRSQPRMVRREFCRILHRATRAGRQS
jgi:putative transposase